jgi:hypothetical protein
MGASFAGLRLKDLAMRAEAMTDREFLGYCRGMAETPRCGFVPEQIARLYRLAGHSALADRWSEQPNGVCNMDRWAIRDAVKQAEDRLVETPKTTAEILQFPR